MNSSYLNMAAGAFLGTCFVAMSLSIVSGAIYSSPNPEKPGFAIKAAEGPAASGAPAKPEVPPIAPLLAKADPAKGEQIFKKCAACHDATKGGPNKIGPNLYGVVDRPIASHPGFSYSSALKTFSDGSKKKWTYDDLNKWLHNPQSFVSGTAMTFPGVKEDQDRADVIAYLHTLADSPVPFPKPEAAKPAAGKGDAKGDAKGADAGKGAAPAKAGDAGKATGNGKAAAPADKTQGGSDQKAPAGSGGDSAQPKASGDQSTKPSNPPSDSAPAGNGANSGTQSNTQGATKQNPQSQGSDQPSKPATQAPAGNDAAPAPNGTQQPQQ